MCFETYSHAVGDACTTDDDCLPVAARDAEGGGLHTTYLACDETAGECVEVPGPAPVGDWLDACDATLVDAVVAPDPEGWGYIEDPSCSAGLCFFIGSGGDCPRAGCVSACTGDWECPQGTWCQFHLQAPSHEPPTRGVCLPADTNDFACYP